MQQDGTGTEALGKLFSSRQREEGLVHA